MSEPTFTQIMEILDSNLGEFLGGIEGKDDAAREIIQLIEHGHATRAAISALPGGEGVNTAQVEAICRAVCKVDGLHADDDTFGDGCDPNWTRYADAVAGVLTATNPANGALERLESLFSRVATGGIEGKALSEAVSALQFAAGAVRDEIFRQNNATPTPTPPVAEALEGQEWLDAWAERRSSVPPAHNINGPFASRQLTAEEAGVREALAKRFADLPKRYAIGEDGNQIECVLLGGVTFSERDAILAALTSPSNGEGKTFPRNERQTGEPRS